MFDRLTRVRVTLLTDMHVYFRKSLHPRTRRSLSTRCGRNISICLYGNHDTKIVVKVDSVPNSNLQKDNCYASVLSSQSHINEAAYNQIIVRGYAITKEEMLPLKPKK